MAPWTGSIRHDARVYGPSLIGGHWPKDERLRLDGAKGYAGPNLTRRFKNEQRRRDLVGWRRLTGGTIGL
jgi:hypothetical protein